MAKNVLSLAVFAFETINGSDYFSVMTRQRMSDGKYELPSTIIDELETDPEDCVRKCLSGSVNLPERVNTFSVGTYPGDKDGEKSIVTVYGVFLDTRPNDAFGINWMIVAPEGTLRKPLEEADEFILSEAQRALITHILCGELSSFTPESKRRLMELFVPKRVLKQIAAQLEGYTKVDVSGLESVPDDDLREALEARQDKDNNPKYHVYDYFHPSLAVDIVVLSKKIYRDDNKFWHVELKLPLIKRSTGLGSGWWGLPGGFIRKEDFIEAGWNGEETDFDYKVFPKYRNALNNGKRTVSIAARRILTEKTGISLDSDAMLYPLYVRDNPMRGTADKVPVVAETLLTIISDFEDKYEVLEPAKNSNVEKARWFTIRRFIYNEKGELIKEEDGRIDKDTVSALSSDKRSPIDLRNNGDETDAFIYGDTLVVNYFKGDRIDNYYRGEQLTAPADGMNPQDMFIFADHRDAIIDALQYVKEQTLTKTILADFMMKSRDELDSQNIFEFGAFKVVYDALVFPEETLRQSLESKVVAKKNTGNNNNKDNNGFLVKPEGNPHGKYRIDIEKYRKFLYRNVSIF